MTLRFRTLIVGSLALAGILPTTSSAQDANVQEELRALRQLVEQQSKKIDALAAQVERLAAQVGPAPGGAPASAADPHAEAAIPAARPVAPPANVHIVVKGDSLDKIAKTHGTSVADLLKLNKITDPKRIQIGQQIILPPKAAQPAH